MLRKHQEATKPFNKLAKHLTMQPISYKKKKTKRYKQTNKPKKEKELLSNILTCECANVFNPNLKCTRAHFLAQNLNLKFE